MRYAININFFRKNASVDFKKTAEIIAAAGFTELDYTPPLLKDGWKDDLNFANEIFTFFGLSVHQTHAPFNRYGNYSPEDYKTALERCAEATEILGARFMVAHGDEFDFKTMEFSPEVALEYNHKLFLPYVKRAEAGGYKVAFETVFEDGRKNERRFTSSADELYSLIQSYGSESAVCCWDFGHANVSFKKKAPEVIRRFGNLIQCTHLHDNAGNDSHQMPLTGDIDWAATMKEFKKIGYDGILSVEYAHGWIPFELQEDFLTLTKRAAERAWSLGN